VGTDKGEGTWARGIRRDGGTITGARKSTGGRDGDLSVVSIRVIARKINIVRLATFRIRNCE